MGWARPRVVGARAGGQKRNSAYSLAEMRALGEGGRTTPVAA